MKINPDRNPAPDSWKDALFRGAGHIVARLREDGHEAYFAGGCVRDMLLHRESPDIDIATSACPEEVTALFPKVIPVGLKYGVVALPVDGLLFEITTFRRDHVYADGRHPEQVEFTNAEADAQRRDFTVNGLFYDPQSDRILDFVDGLTDLHARLIKAIGRPADRFYEDHLRMLRAVRFASVLDFTIEPVTLEAIRQEASCITRISPERIRDELFKMFLQPRPAAALDLLDSSGLLPYILPEIHAMKGVEQPPEYHPEGDVFLHTRKMLQFLEHPTRTLVMGVLLHDVGKPTTYQVSDRIRFDQHVEVGAQTAETICRRLRLSKEETVRIVDLVRQHMRFMPVREMRPSTLKRFLRLPHFDEHLELHRLDCAGSHGDLSNWEFCREKLRELQQEDLRPARLLSGKDLIEQGYLPGPLFKQILSALEEAQLEGELSDREGALSWLRNNYPLIMSEISWRKQK